MNCNLPVFSPNEYKHDLYFFQMIEQAKLNVHEHLYSRELLELKQFIANECDRIDTPDCMIYDECPDKFLFLKLCKELCEMALFSTSYGKMCKSYERLYDVVRLLLANEFYERRTHTKSPSFYSCNHFPN